MNHLFRYNQQIEQNEQGSMSAEDVVILEGEVQESVESVASAAETLQCAEQDIMSAGQAVDSLYALADAVEQSVDRNPSTDAVVEVALEHIYQSIGFDKPRSLSMEAGFADSVKDKADKIREHATKILAAIIEAFRKAIEWVKDYVSEATNAAQRLNKYAKKLRYDLSKSGEIRGNNFTDKSLAKALGDVGQLTKRVENLADLVKDASRSSLFGGHIALMNELIDGYVKAEDKASVETLIKLAMGIPDVLKKAYDGIFSHEDELIQVSEHYAPKGTSTYSTDYLPGNYLGVLVLPDGLDTLNYLSFNIRRDNEEAEKEAGNGVVKALTAKEIKHYLEAVIAITDDIINFRSMDGELKRVVAKLTAATEQLKTSPKEMTKEDRQMLKAISVMAPYVAKGIHSRVFGHAVQSCQALLKYCVKSMDAQKALA